MKHRNQQACVRVTEAEIPGDERKKKIKECGDPVCAPVAESDQQFAAEWNAIFEPESAEVFELFQRLSARIPIYAFSNSNAIHQEFWERKYAKTLGMFREVFVSWELGLRKPEAAAFRQVAACIGSEPKKLLFFDDSAENVDGARDIGMSAVKVRGFADIRVNVMAFLE